jgi:hypothetical protein
MKVSDDRPVSLGREVMDWLRDESWVPAAPAPVVEHIKVSPEEPMGFNHEQHLAEILWDSRLLIEAKYRKGQAEHGGFLPSMTREQLLDNAIAEAIDQLVYLLTLKGKKG